MILAGNKLFDIIKDIVHKKDEVRTRKWRGQTTKKTPSPVRSHCSDTRRFPSQTVFKIECCIWLNRRYRLIFSNPAVEIAEDKWTEISYHFSLNLPNNLLEEAQTAAQLTGTTARFRINWSMCLRYRQCA